MDQYKTIDIQLNGTKLYKYLQTVEFVNQYFSQVISCTIILNKKL